MSAAARFGAVIVGCMAAFVVVYLGVVALMGRLAPPAPWAAALLLVPLVPLAGALGGIVQRHRRGADELEQRIELLAMTLTAGVLLMAGTYWGLLVRFLDVPPFPLDMALPVAAVTWSMLRLLIGRTYQ